MEILVLHPGALGDIILALPAIALLRDRHRSARVTIAGNVEYLAVVARGYADKIVSLSTLPLHRLYAGERLPPHDLNLWRSFDLIVSWTGAGDGTFLQNLNAANPRARVAAWRPNRNECRHVSQIFADSLIPGTISTTRVASARIELDPEWRLEATKWLSDHGCTADVRLASVHPGAGSRLKRWSEDRFLQVAHHLISVEKRKVLLVGGPAEFGLVERIAGLLPPSSFDDVLILADLPLHLVAALVQRSELFIGNDSGIAHLAAALRVPSLVLFGPTDPRHWAPLGDHVTVLRKTEGCEACASSATDAAHSCLSSISVDTAIDGIKNESFRQS